MIYHPMFLAISGVENIKDKDKCGFCEFLGLDSEININNHGVPEFSSWKWVDRNKIVELSVDFKKELYSKILSEFNSYF